LYGLRQLPAPPPAAIGIVKLDRSIAEVVETAAGLPGLQVPLGPGYPLDPGYLLGRPAPAAAEHG